MTRDTGMRIVVMLIPAFVAGALAFYALLLHGSNLQLASEIDAMSGLEIQLQAQQQLNTRQREEFETRIQQLQDNLTGAQAQMSNLSQALQEARELITPIVEAPPPEADSAIDIPPAQ